MNAQEKLVTMARDAGRAGESWDHWSASDEVQDLICSAENLDTDPIESAFAEGRRERCAATWRVVWTTAPADYDTGDALELETCGPWHGKTLRKVAIDPEGYVYQTSRYWSGIHNSWDEDPRAEEARIQARIAAERADREARDAKRAAGLEWLKTAAEDELEDFNTFEARGVRYDDVRAEKKRREAESAKKTCADEWARCLAAIPEGSTLIDAGEPSRRDRWGYVVKGRAPHVYYDVRIVRGWPDEADRANVMGQGNDNAGSASLVADWIISGRLRVASPGEVPPFAVVARIGHEHV